MTRLPDERDMEQAVRSWMRDDNERPADRNRQVGRIMGRIDETRQRRGAWRYLPFWRSSRSGDETDDDLHPARREGFAPSFMALVAVLALMVTSLAFFALRPNDDVPTPAARPSPSPTAQPTMDPADAALFARSTDVWSGVGPSLADVREVYADDAVHTVLWQDKVERVCGADAIWQRIQASSSVDPGDMIRLPDVLLGPRAHARRYLGVSQNLGGIACVFWIEDDRIIRHDCILPTDSTDPRTPDFPSATPGSIEQREAIRQDFVPGWAEADVELIERTVSPKIVHHVAMDNHSYTLAGIPAYLSVMGGGTPGELAPPVALPAPEGETRWTDFSTVGGGSLCTFWARDGLIARHDCIVPASMVVRPVPETPVATATPEPAPEA
jgi:hypothetical protein